jgi:hypothetical protein
MERAPLAASFWRKVAGQEQARVSGLLALPDDVFARLERLQVMGERKQRFPFLGAQRLPELKLAQHGREW